MAAAAYRWRLSMKTHDPSAVLIWPNRTGRPNRSRRGTARSRPEVPSEECDGAAARRPSRPTRLTSFHPRQREKRRHGEQTGRPTSSRRHRPAAVRAGPVPCPPPGSSCPATKYSNRPRRYRLHGPNVGLTGQFHRLPDALEAYGVMIARQSRSADLIVRTPKRRCFPQHSEHPWVRYVLFSPHHRTQ